MAAGDALQFIIDDTSTGAVVPVVRVTITENANGTVTFSIVQLVAEGNYLGDLRGFFSDLAEENLIGSILILGDVVMTLADGSTQIVAGSSVALVSGNDSVTSAGSSSTNVNGLTDGGYDLGIEIGTNGIGCDDVRAFVFTLSSSTRNLTLADFINVDFAVRIQSVGLDTDGDGFIDAARIYGAKIGEALTAAESAVTLNGSTGNDVISLGEGANTVSAGSGDDIVYTQTDGITDLVDGGADTDQVTVQGVSDTGETYVIVPFEQGGITYLIVDDQSTAGVDVLTTNVEEIVLVAGSGSDQVYIQGDLSQAGVAQDTVIVYGGDGDDVIDASGLVGDPPVSAELYGEADNDTLIGGGGNDLLDGGADNDTLTGGAGDDVLVGGAGINTLDGGLGNDFLDGGVYYTGSNTMAGGDDDDFLNTRVAGDIIDGGAGIDYLSLDRGTDTQSWTLSFVWNAAGSIDSFTAPDGTSVSGVELVSLSSGLGDDIITFTNVSPDLLNYDTDTFGFVVLPGVQFWQDYGGDDAGTFDLSSFTSDIVTTGSTSRYHMSTLAGVAGEYELFNIQNVEHYTIIGGSGNDVLSRADGNNTLVGNSGDDTLAGGSGNDTLDGGADIDTADYSTDTAGVTVELTGAGGTATGSAIGGDTLIGIEKVIGGAGDDTLTADQGGATAIISLPVPIPLAAAS